MGKVQYWELAAWQGFTLFRHNIFILTKILKQYSSHISTNTIQEKRREKKNREKKKKRQNREKRKKKRKGRKEEEKKERKEEDENTNTNTI